MQRSSLARFAGRFGKKSVCLCTIQKGMGPRGDGEERMRKGRGREMQACVHLHMCSRLLVCECVYVNVLEKGFNYMYLTYVMYDSAVPLFGGTWGSRSGSLFIFSPQDPGIYVISTC